MTKLAIDKLRSWCQNAVTGGRDFESADSSTVLLAIGQRMREEIIEAENARIDLLKWKIIGVAAIGGAALGVGPGTSSKDLLLCLIPLICLYVDLICSHLNLRIMVIGSYFRLVHRRQMLGEKIEPNDADYEEFAEEVRSMPQSAPVRTEGLNAFFFEDRALHLSSGILSVLVIVWGIFGVSFGAYKAVLIVTGSLGALFSLQAHFTYEQHLDALKGLVSERIKKLVP